MCGVKVVWALSVSHSAQASLASSLASERQGSLLAWPTWRGLIKTETLSAAQAQKKQQCVLCCAGIISDSECCKLFAHDVCTLNCLGRPGLLPADWFMRYFCHYWRNLFCSNFYLWLYILFMRSKVMIQWEKRDFEVEYLVVYGSFKIWEFVWILNFEPGQM